VSIMDIDPPNRDDGERRQRGRGFQDAQGAAERGQSGGGYDSLPAEKSGPGPAKCESLHLHLPLHASLRLMCCRSPLTGPSTAVQPWRAG